MKVFFTIIFVWQRVMVDNAATLSTRGALSLPADKIRAVHHQIRCAIQAELPTEKLSFQEPDDVVSNCNGTVMNVDVWPLCELTPAKSDMIKKRLQGLGGSLDIWPTSHPSRGACIRVAWSSGGSAEDSSSSEKSQGFATYTLVVMLFAVVFVVVWVRLVPASWKLNTLETVIPGSREYILRLLGWIGAFMSKRSPAVA